MANGLQTLGRALQGFAAGVQDPGFASRQSAEQARLTQQQQQFEQRQSAARNTMRLALIQNALQNLPAGHSARPKLEAKLSELSGLEGLGIGASFTKAPEKQQIVNIPVGGRVGAVTQGPQGAELDIIGEGRSPQPKVPLLTIEGDKPVFGQNRVDEQLNELYTQGREARVAEQDYQQLADLIINPEV